MNRIVTLMLGIVAAVVASLVGLVLIPERQLGPFQPVTVTAADGSQETYPQPRDAWREEPGKRVYQSLGCIYCHSQQVRPENFGADLLRGWGRRRSVPRDYLFEDPPLLGSMRTGPDLANAAQRQPSADWHYLHLYDPQITSPGSVMPSFRFLFDVTDAAPGSASDAVRLPGGDAERSRWIIPKQRARDLVGYLLSLDQRHALEDVR
jgi:cytochrome c oxidase cbb3-type subunit 2